MSYTVRPSQTKTQTRNATQTVEDSDTVAPESKQRLWVLVGVIGSGKSHFADQIALQIPNWKRICQDVVGSRKAVYDLADQALTQGMHVIIDRQNFDSEQRAHWVRLARSHAVEISALVFNTPSSECRRRLASRTDHETIQSSSEAIRLHEEFAAQFEDVASEEGFDRIYNLPSDLPYILDIPYCLNLIKKVDSAPRLPEALRVEQARGKGRGRGSRERNRGGIRRGKLPGNAAISDRHTRGSALNARSPSTQFGRSPAPSTWQRGGGNRLGAPAAASTSVDINEEGASLRARMAQAAEARLSKMQNGSTEAL